MGDFLAFTVADPNHRNIAMRPSEPLPDHVKECIAFLERVSSLAITGGDKKDYEITVQLTAPPADNQSEATSFTIKRTAKEFATIQSVVRDHCRQHVDLQKYQVASCALCSQFNELEPLRVGTRDVVFKSVESIREKVQARLVTLVERALVAPSATHLHCEGQVRVPSALAKFLLRGVDQTKL